MTTTQQKPIHRQWTAIAALAALLIAAAVTVTAVRLTASDGPADDPAMSWSGEGITEGAIVYRRTDQTVAAVAVAYHPTDIRPAYCQLVVRGETVRDTSIGGFPAVCVWADGVTWDGAPTEHIASVAP